MVICNLNRLQIQWKKAAKCDKDEIMSDEKKYHKGDVKTDAVNVAFAIVQAEGGRKLTMRHLADEIGISHTALYRHYKNKDAVLLEVASKGYRQLMLKMAASLQAQDKNSAEQLCDAALAYVGFADEHGEIYRLMNGDFAQGANGNAAITALADKMFEILKLIILKGQAEGVFKADDAEQLAFALWSLLHGYVELSLRGGKRPDAESTVKLLVNGFVK